MQYIAFDLEFNQDFDSALVSNRNRSRCPFEIIQIGAVKLDSDFHSIASFNRFIRPEIYQNVSPFITELTGITTEQLQKEATFSEVFMDYMEFVNDTDSVFCVWGMTDMKELFRSSEYYQLNQNLIPRLYINLQPYVSMYLGLSAKKLLNLQYTVEKLDIPLTCEFHDALNDAYYTAEVLKKIYHSILQPKRYDPLYVKVHAQSRAPKRVIDFASLIKQFEKMYSREITDEEQSMIKLAYQMGKTQQFLKDNHSVKENIYCHE